MGCCSTWREIIHSSWVARPRGYSAGRAGQSAHAHQRLSPRPRARAPAAGHSTWAAPLAQETQPRDHPGALDPRGACVQVPPASAPAPARPGAPPTDPRRTQVDEPAPLAPRAAPGDQGSRPDPAAPEDTMATSRVVDNAPDKVPASPRRPPAAGPPACRRRSLIAALPCRAARRPTSSTSPPTTRCHASSSWRRAASARPRPALRAN